MQARLLVITSDKWHTPCQIRWKSLSFDDLEGHRQPVRSAILATAGLVASCLPILLQYSADRSPPVDRPDPLSADLQQCIGRGGG